MILAFFIWAMTAEATWSDVRVREMLALPVFNRELIAKSFPDSELSAVENLAFSENESMATRWRALMFRVKKDPSTSKAFLNRAKTSPVWYLRSASLVASSIVSTDFAYDVAVELLQDPAMVVRSASAKALGDLQRPAATRFLEKELNSPRNFRNGQSLWVRRQIADSILKLNPHYPPQKVSAWLEDQDPQLRKIAEKRLSVQ